MGRTPLIATLLVVLARPWSVAAAPSAETLAAWQTYVEATEARRAGERPDGARFLARDFDRSGPAARQAALDGQMVIEEWRTRAPTGQSWTVPDGQIHHWVGTAFVPGVDLPTLLDRLHGTEVQARQPDVLAARILSRDPSGLTLYLRLRRSQIVTVTYDTEHRVRFTRLDPSRATSTSVATRIVEVDAPGTPDERPRAAADDRGFLWRLNAYWRYEAVPGGVLVECESISLSRRVPFGLGAVAGPFITRIARESMSRTLDAMREVLGRPTRQLSTQRRAL